MKEKAVGSPGSAEVPSFGYFLPDLLAAAAIALAATVGLTAAGWLLLSVTPRGRLLAEADTLSERIRYSLTIKRAGEAGVSAGKGAVSFKSSRGRELVERPTTTSSLVYDFRALAARVAAVVRPGRVVVAIDELDKMSDPDKVRALLREVKGIFEIEGVHFLVSISYEAARALKLGGIADRDEFSSSFYTVLELSALTPDQCAEMITARSRLHRAVRRRALRARRTSAGSGTRSEHEELLRLDRWLNAEMLVPLPDDASTGQGHTPSTSKRSRHLEKLQRDHQTQEDSEHLRSFEERQRLLARAVGVLAAGNARETVRMFATVPNRAFIGSERDAVESAMRALLLSEFHEFRREAFAFSAKPGRRRAKRDISPPSHDAASVDDLSLTDDQRTGLFRAIREIDRAPKLWTVATKLAAETWDPAWATDLWRVKFQEDWRRLLVRLYAAAYLAEHPPVQSDSDALQVRAVVERTTESAAVGRLMISESPFDASFEGGALGAA